MSCEMDGYGNPISGDRIINCRFPDCGCDGSRLCQAENGPSFCAHSLNLERDDLAPILKRGMLWQNMTTKK